MAGGGIKFNNISVIGGANGKTPIFKIEDGHLYNSYNNGSTWNDLGQVRGVDGSDGADGATGAKLVSQVLQGQDIEGGNIYKQTFDDGTIAYFVAPKGEKGDSGDFNIVDVDANTTIEELGTEPKILRVNFGQPSGGCWLWSAVEVQSGVVKVELESLFGKERFVGTVSVSLTIAILMTADYRDDYATEEELSDVQYDIQDLREHKLDITDFYPDTTLSGLMGKGGIGVIRNYTYPIAFTYNVIYANGNYVFEIESLLDIKRYSGEVSENLTLDDILFTDDYRNDYATKSDLDGKVDKIDLNLNTTLLELVDTGGIMLIQLPNFNSYWTYQVAYVSGNYQFEIESLFSKLRYAGSVSSANTTLAEVMVPAYQKDYATEDDLDGLVPNTRTVNGHALSSDVTVTKSDVGLGNVDNTSDANKPISTAVAAALVQKVDLIQISTADKLSDIVARAKSGIIRLYTTDYYYTFNIIPDGNGGYEFEIESLLDTGRWAGFTPVDLLFTGIISDTTYQDDYATFGFVLNALSDKQDVLTFDSTPTQNSNNPVTSNGIYTAIQSAISSVYRFKGSVATYADLPSTGLTVGDVYNVQDTDKNYAWTGTAWDDLGGSLSGYVPTSRTIAGNALTGDISAASLVASLFTITDVTVDED